MEIQAIIELVMAQAAIWAPGLTAVLGIVIALIPTLHKVIEALGEIKDTTKDVRKTKDFDRLHTDLRQAHVDNKELKEQMEMIIDRLACVEGYYKYQMELRKGNPEESEEGNTDERENTKTEE